MDSFKFSERMLKIAEKEFVKFVESLEDTGTDWFKLSPKDMYTFGWSHGFIAAGDAAKQMMKEGKGNAEDK